MDLVDLVDLEDDRWETWGIAARWDSMHGWHDPQTHVVDAATARYELSS